MRLTSLAEAEEVAKPSLSLFPELIATYAEEAQDRRVVWHEQNQKK